MTSRLLVVVGARPNYMKAASLFHAAPAAGLEPVLVHTGQHYDPELSTLIMEELGLPEPAWKLEVGRGRSALGQLAALLEALPAVVEAVRPGAMVVVGDVTSTLAGALVAARAGATPLPLAHVEAGLRSFDRGMPEETNRLLTDALADLLLCSEPSGLENLMREGKAPASVLLVGNTMIDTLLRLRPRAQALQAPGRFGVRPGEYGLVTLHRPSNVDEPARLRALLEMLGELSRELPLLFPVHPRTRARLGELHVPPSLRLVEPQGYLPFVGLMEAARLVLTDSGGIQEETTVLGVPCLTLRANTERPITISAGTNLLVGTDPPAILAQARAALARPRPAPQAPPLWDGRAGERIAAALAGLLAGGPEEARARALALGAVAARPFPDTI